MKEDIYRSQFRLPYSLYELLKESADRNKRHLNKELVFRLETSMLEDRYQRYLEERGISPEEEKETIETLERAWPARKVVPVQTLSRNDELDAEISKLGLEQRAALLALLKSIRK